VWKFEMLDFNGQLSLAAGGAAWETLDDFAYKKDNLLVFTSGVSLYSLIYFA
jgi:hypothetical protein